MAQSGLHRVQAEVSAEVPAERTYESADNAEMDRALVNAIDAAEQAGDEYLVKLLSLEVASHFWGTQ